MIDWRAVLLAGGPNNATAQNRLAREATAFIEDKARAEHLAEQLAVAIAELEGKGECRILDSVEENIKN